MTLRETADLMDRILQEKQLAKYKYSISQSEKQELNLENGGFKLLRTVFSGSAFMQVFRGAKMGSANGTDITEAGLRKLAEEAKAAAESASEDPCHDIAPDHRDRDESSAPYHRHDQRSWRRARAGDHPLFGHRAEIRLSRGFPAYPKNVASR